MNPKNLNLVIGAVISVTSFLTVTGALADGGPTKWLSQAVYGPVAPTTADLEALEGIGRGSLAYVGLSDYGIELVSKDQGELIALMKNNLAALPGVRQRAAARLAEIQKGDPALKEKGQIFSSSFGLEFDAYSSHHGNFIDEDKYDEKLSQCQKKLQSAFIDLMAYPRYKQVLKDAAVEKVGITVVDNRGTPSSDRMFQVHSLLVKGTPRKPISPDQDDEDLNYKAGEFRIRGLLDSNGNCVEIRDQLVAEFEVRRLAYATPELDPNLVLKTTSSPSTITTAPTAAKTSQRKKVVKKAPAKKGTKKTTKKKGVNKSRSAR